MSRLSVAVLGATGLVGQQLLRLLDGHPWFEVTELVASERSAGRRYADAVDWILPDAIPETVAGRVVVGGAALLSGEAELQAPLGLSALPRSTAAMVEPRLAAAGHVVCSNASAFRADPRVPLVVPEINPGHLELVGEQPWRASGGALITKPNCMVCGLSLALAPLHRRLGVESVVAVTMQALSGAGRTGLAALATSGNVIPGIAGQADKIAAEPGKILDARFPISVMVHRVPVVDGHLASVFVRPTGRPVIDQVQGALRGFRGAPDAAALPSAPPAPLRLLESPGRPQPRLDVGAGEGMAVSVGNVGIDSQGWITLTVLVHNLIRGAAGACLLNAELAVARGLVGWPPGLRRDRAAVGDAGAAGVEMAGGS